MTTGKGSNFQLTRLAATYNEIQSNGRILSNRKAMDIIWLRVQQLAERIDTNQAPERMTNLQKLWANYRESLMNGESVQATLLMRQIDDEFEAAYHDYVAWKQMFEALELHSKMTESEVKIMKDLRAIMTAEDAYELVAKVMAVLLRVLQDDPKRLKEAQFELGRLVGEGFDGRFGGGSRQSAGFERPDSLDGEELLYSRDARSTPEIDGLPQGRDPGSPESG